MGALRGGMYLMHCMGHCDLADVKAGVCIAAHFVRIYAQYATLQKAPGHQGQRKRGV
jgi:hypothetical protein